LPVLHKTGEHAVARTFHNDLVVSLFVSPSTVNHLNPTDMLANLFARASNLVGDTRSTKYSANKFT
jgi:hypothetical protein